MTDALERAFVAVSYTLGVRGEALLRPLGAAPPAGAVALARALAQPERTARGRALAAELLEVRRALEALRWGAPG